MERQERNDLILDCAAALFAEKGIAATTVRDIAGRAGILSGSLYHYFASKDAMADHIVTQYLDELLDEYRRIVATDTDARSAVAGLVMASSRVSRAHRHASEIYQRETVYLRRLPSSEQIRAAARTIRETWITVLQRGIEAGDLRDDLPVELLYLLVRDAVWLTLRSFAPTPEFDVDRVARSITSVFLDGAIARPHEGTAA